MDDDAAYLPDVYQSFRRRFGDVVDRHDAVAEAVDAAGPLDEQTVRLAKLGIALGAQADGAVRSNVRKALEAGVSREAIEQVILLGLTTRGFPATIAAWKWAGEVFAAEDH
ncbi:carboxymuconolactone decarboxylase family protein [Georgenia sp. H159]|uniref:carboxymuconolactone decarboxylase family protein n=1 Tax=Georgenia sp. H159 TaxID=3076115 RepID=UPI002D7931F3|nr:carboxymuconolactone decarboxylase family protein [Georgenia sp. H159]